MHQVIENLNKENLSTYFVLPLLGVNKDRFGENNFLNCYLSKNRQCCYVKVKMPFDPLPIEPTHHEGAYYYKFLIPEKWRMEVECFCNGEYSKFSDDAKAIIYKDSTLIYKAQISNGQETIISTDIRLLALRKDSTVKDFWSNQIYASSTESEITPDMELLSIPTEKDFIESEISV